MLDDALQLLDAQVLPVRQQVQQEPHARLLTADAQTRHIAVEVLRQHHRRILERHVAML